MQSLNRAIVLNARPGSISGTYSRLSRDASTWLQCHRDCYNPSEKQNIWMEFTQDTPGEKNPFPSSRDYLAMRAS
jgi:hypothetical protein